MVGIVIVSHSRELADSIVEFTKMMAPEALILSLIHISEPTRP